MKSDLHKAEAAAREIRAVRRRAVVSVGKTAEHRKLLRQLTDKDLFQFGEMDPRQQQYALHRRAVAARQGRPILSKPTSTGRIK